MILWTMYNQGTAHCSKNQIFNGPSQRTESEDSLSPAVAFASFTSQQSPFFFLCISLLNPCDVSCSVVHQRVERSQNTLIFHMIIFLSRQHFILYLPVLLLTLSPSAQQCLNFLFSDTANNFSVHNYFHGGQNMENILMSILYFHSQVIWVLERWFPCLPTAGSHIRCLSLPCLYQQGNSL